jgi:lysophospholipase
LSGCDRKPLEPGESHIPPSLAERFYPPVGWAWGSLQVEGAPTLRYGVAVPPRATRGEVLILPGAGEPAEAWFETARTLIDQNYGVWILDLAGQGGSGRWEGAPDHLYAKTLDVDVTAVRRMVETVVRPGGRTSLVLIGDGLGAQIALRAVAEPLAGVDGAVLSAPALTPRPVSLPFGLAGADLARRFGLGAALAPGEQGWKAPAGRDRSRDGVIGAWMQTNPDLRMGGASVAWIAAFNRSAEAAANPAGLKRAKARVLMLADPQIDEPRKACAGLPACKFVIMKGQAAHRGQDADRQTWLKETGAFLATVTQNRPVAVPGLGRPAASGANR